MMSIHDRSEFAALLDEATRGSMCGIRLGDRVETLRDRLGEPKPNGMAPNLLQYGPLQFIFNDEGVIGSIYVEVPNGIELALDVLPDVPTPVPTVDPAHMTTRVGSAFIHVDANTRQIRSFAVWP